MAYTQQLTHSQWQHTGKLKTTILNSINGYTLINSLEKLHAINEVEALCLQKEKEKNILYIESYHYIVKWMND